METINKSMSLDELSMIKGAFDEGVNYECVVALDIDVFKVGVTYTCNGEGIVDEYDGGDDTSICSSGDREVLFRLIDVVSAVRTIKDGDRVRVSYKNGDINTYHGLLVYTGKLNYVLNFLGEEVWVPINEVTLKHRAEDTTKDKLIAQLNKDLEGCDIIEPNLAQELVEMGWEKTDEQ
tara:strand:- start:221 stop:754 length:534 start_codon:yes stop_codon:yes gene_type:complete